ncbi:MAG TPA: metalloregulator ArsR/SmtB family transcription factor, partial [Terriglobales bacterium]|nr:metalloregulator ArsR/SmtB family transcription factor [Terriglobales bacterium]
MSVEKKLTLDALLKTLADRTRLRLLNLMGDHEICVCFLVEALKTSQPKISRHLAYLRRSGIVAARREGLWMHYRISRPSDTNLARVLDSVLESAAHGPEMKKDLARLSSACCAPKLIT